MKLLSLNTHSLQEENGGRKLECFARYLLQEQPDLIALQEVNQSAGAPAVAPEELVGLVPLPGCAIPVRSDNYALQLARRLRGAGLGCSWAWLPVKLGYGSFDEGLAVFSLHNPIAGLDVQQVSYCSDYRNWKTRKILGACVEGRPDWFYSVHMGWWDDAEEPFRPQWERLERSLAEKKARGPVWLLGDFNAPAERRGEGYDLIQGAGWQDAWLLAETTRGCATVSGELDGWRGRDVGREGMRIDHIWCSRAVPVARGQVVFDGVHEPRVSDHSGVLLETKE